MNAKDLHELYSPLWEKVPETRPKAGSVALEYCQGPGFMDDDEPNDLPPLEGQHERRVGKAPWSWRWGKPGRVVDEWCAAALCRVAVEDWLLHKHKGRQGCDRDVSLAWARTGGDYHVDCSDVPFNLSAKCCHHPTIHHALVAAALAVKGVG